MVDKFDYSRLRSTANRLIGRFGPISPAIFLEPTSGSGDAFNQTEGAPTQHPVDVVVLNYDRKEIDGARILATDKKVLIAVGDGSLTPSSTWSLSIGGIVYQLAAPLSPLQPGDTVLLWEAQCRRA